MNRILTIVAGALFVAMVGVYGYRLMFANKMPRADELEKVALQDSDPAHWQQAASDLISLGTKPNMFLEPVPNIRRVLEKSTDPQVRAMMILGIGQIKDWDSLPTVIDDLGDDSVVVRQQASSTVQSLLSYDPHFLGYDALAPAARRKVGIDKIRERWDDMKSTEFKQSKYSKAEWDQYSKEYSKEDLEKMASRFHDTVLQPYHAKLKELNIPVAE